MRNVRLNRFLVQAERSAHADRGPLHIIPASPAHCVRVCRRGDARGPRLHRVQSDQQPRRRPESASRSAPMPNARARGDVNYVVRRGALLHSDSRDAPSARAGRAIWQFVHAVRRSDDVGGVDISDGRSLDVGMSAAHWDIARLALDQVRSPGTDKPAPGRDAMVRAWVLARRPRVVDAVLTERGSRHDSSGLRRAGSFLTIRICCS